jgi:hypothetical protein
MTCRSFLRFSLPSVALALVLVACGGRGLESPPTDNPPAQDPGPDGGTRSCTDQGTVHMSGSAWRCSDGCNTCNCEDGSIVSTLLACVAPPVGCVESGTVHAPETTWTCADDGCSVCACSSSGSLTRSNALCEISPPDGGADADGSTSADAAVDADAGVPGKCGPDEHLCACATGSYCLLAGAECLDTTAPCPCQKAEDCVGALPAVCAICSDGSEGCAHFVCTGGACQTAFCN